MNHLPYIPVWFDEHGLSVAEFRVYSTLCSRAGKKGQCWPSAKTIAATCGIHRDTVWDALSVLERRGLVRREKTFRNSNLYTVLVPAGASGKRGPAEPVDSAESDGRQLAGNAGYQTPETEGQQLAEYECRKGSKGKSRTQNFLKGEGALTTLPQSLDDFQAEKISRELHLGKDEVAKLYSRYRQRKLGHSEDWAHAKLVDLPDMVIGFAREKNGAELQRVQPRKKNYTKI